VLQQNLQTTYGSIDNVDLFVGGLAEAHVNNGRLGQTFQAIIGSQFQNLRTGDRYWWQNEAFDPHTASMISGTSLATILRRDTDSTNVPEHVFVPSGGAAQVSPATVTSTATPVDTHGRPFILPQACIFCCRYQEKYPAYFSWSSGLCQSLPVMVRRQLGRPHWQVIAPS
jgi:Animal haem peroxidase